MCGGKISFNKGNKAYLCRFICPVCLWMHKSILSTSTFVTMTKCVVFSCALDGTFKSIKTGFWTKLGWSSVLSTGVQSNVKGGPSPMILCLPQPHIPVLLHWDFKRFPISDIKVFGFGDYYFLSCVLFCSFSDFDQHLSASPSPWPSTVTKPISRDASSSPQTCVIMFTSHVKPWINIWCRAK